MNPLHLGSVPLFFSLTDTELLRQGEEEKKKKKKFWDVWKRNKEGFLFIYLAELEISPSYGFFFFFFVEFYELSQWVYTQLC